MKFIKTLSYISLFAIFLLTGFYFLMSSKNTNTEKQNPTPIPTDIPPPANDFISYSPEQPPKESLTGQIIEMTGDIYWQSRTATESVKLNSPQKIQQGEKLETKDGGLLKLAFENTVDIEMSEKTILDVIQTLPANLVFRQTKGISYFETYGNVPVTVRALSTLTDINGKAKISVDDDKGIVVVKVDSGGATLAYNDLKYISHQVKLTSGDVYTFNHGKRKGVLK